MSHSWIFSLHFLSFSCARKNVICMTSRRISNPIHEAPRALPLLHSFQTSFASSITELSVFSVSEPLNKIRVHDARLCLLVGVTKPNMPTDPTLVRRKNIFTRSKADYIVQSLLPASDAPTMYWLQHLFHLSRRMHFSAVVFARSLAFQKTSLPGQSASLQ